MDARVETKSAEILDKSIIRNLLQKYLKELSQFDVASQSDDEVSEYEYLDDYWTSDNRYPFLIIVKDDIVGFSFVRKLENNTFQIAEFYILPDYRGKCIGSRSAVQIFNQFKGVWHVAQGEKNIPAQKFWRSVIHKYTDGNFEEERSDEQPRGVKQIFNNDQSITTSIDELHEKLKKA